MKCQNRLKIQLLMFLFVNAAITYFATYFKADWLRPSKLWLNKHL